MGVPEVLGSPGPLRPPRPRTRWAATCREAAVAAAAVAAASALAVTTVPPAPTPPRVAGTFVHALFDRNWPAAWTALCRPDRRSLDYQTFAHQLALLNGQNPLPSAVDLDVGPVRAARHPADPVTVRVTATSDEPHGKNWSLTGEVPLVVENGAVRVCFTAGR